MFFVLKRTLELDDPWILGKSEDVALGSHVSHLILVDHFVLFHLFDRYNLPSLAVPADTNFTESTSANDLKWLKVLDCNFSTPMKNIC